MTPLFCDMALAERIERAEAQLMAKATEGARERGPSFALDVAGGVASFAGPGSPFNKVAGLGFAGVPSAAELDEIEHAFAAYRTPVQVELAHLADPELGAVLIERGYRLEGYENVLGLVPDEHPGQRATPAGVEVRHSGDDEFETWLEVVIEGVATPDTQGLASHEAFPRQIVADAMRDFAAANMLRYIAVHDGVVAGGASFRVADGIAQFGGAATVPAHRRRGIQTALLAARLADASSAGCDVGVVTTQPGSKSQQNVQRQGFDLLYTRAVFVKG